MCIQLLLPLVVLIAATGVLAAPAPTPVPTPVPTTTKAYVERRGTETTEDYEPHITIDVPQISIKPYTHEPFSLSLDLPSNTCTPTITPDANGWVPATECNALYNYYPSFGVAIAFSVLFGVLMVPHFIQATVYKAGFVWFIVMSAAWECVGFVVRTLSTREQQDNTLATITQLFILLSPLCMLSHLFSSSLKQLLISGRGQCIRLHGSGSDDPLLRPGSSNRHLQTLHARHDLCRPGPGILCHPIDRR